MSEHEIEELNFDNITQHQRQKQNAPCLLCPQSIRNLNQVCLSEENLMRSDCD